MLTPSLKNFITRYAPSIALIVNPHESAVLKVDPADVHIIRPWSAKFDRLVENWNSQLLPFPQFPPFPVEGQGA